MAELVLGWRNLILILSAIGVATQILFICKKFAVSLYVYLALSIVSQPKFPIHLINSRSFSLRMLDIKTVAYVATLLIIAMILVFNKYCREDCEKLAPMFLCFQALETFAGVLLVKDSYKKNLLLDTIRLQKIVQYEDEQIQTDPVDNENEGSDSDEGVIRQVMDTNVVPSAQPVFTNVPMREEQSARVIQVHSRQMLFNTNEVI